MARSNEMRSFRPYLEKGLRKRFGPHQTAAFVAEARAALVSCGQMSRLMRVVLMSNFAKVAPILFGKRTQVPPNFRDLTLFVCPLEVLLKTQLLFDRHGMVPGCQN